MSVVCEKRYFCRFSHWSRKQTLYTYSVLFSNSYFGNIDCLKLPGFALYVRNLLSLVPTMHQLYRNLFFTHRRVLNVSHKCFIIQRSHSVLLNQVFKTHKHALYCITCSHKEFCGQYRESFSITVA